MPTNFEGADKKLRRAEFFRDHLLHHSKEIAKSMNRAVDADYRFLPGEAWPKMVDIQDDWSHTAQYYNAAIFGPRVMTEHARPDGAIVRAHGGPREHRLLR